MYLHKKVTEDSNEITIQIDHNGQLSDKLKEYLVNRMYKTGKKALIHYRLNTNIRKWFEDPDKFSGFKYCTPYIERERDYNGIVDLIPPIQIPEIKDKPFVKAFNKSPKWGKMNFELSPDYRRIEDKRRRYKERRAGAILGAMLGAIVSPIISPTISYILSCIPKIVKQLIL